MDLSVRKTSKSGDELGLKKLGLKNKKGGDELGLKDKKGGDELGLKDKKGRRRGEKFDISEIEDDDEGENMYSSDDDDEGDDESGGRRVNKKSKSRRLSETSKSGDELGLKDKKGRRRGKEVYISDIEDEDDDDEGENIYNSDMDDDDDESGSGSDEENFNDPGLKSKMKAKNFNYEEYNQFCTSFNTNVANSVRGKMGDFYKDKYRGILKVFVGGDEVQGTAFVICKSQNVYILLTCNHTFNEWKLGKSVEVMSSEFKYFKAEVWYRDSEMDFCLLIVRDDMGPNVMKLKTYCGKVNFGEDIFSISCPAYSMSADETPQPLDFDKRLLGTLWFTMTRACVSHPFLVGVHKKNLKGTYMQLQGGAWGNGASGSPIFNMKGYVIGMFISSTSDNSESFFVNHWALRLSSVRDHLERSKGEGASMGGKSPKGNSLSKVVRRFLEEREDQ